MDQYWNQVYQYYRRLGHADANARALTAQALQRAGHAATSVQPAPAPAPAPAAERQPVTTGAGASRSSNYTAAALAAAAVFAAAQRQVTGAVPGSGGPAAAAAARQAAPASAFANRVAGAAAAAAPALAGAQQAGAAASAYATQQAEAAARLVRMQQEQAERARREWEARQRQLREREQEAQQHQEAAQVHEEGNADDEGGDVDIYEQYQPAKVLEGPPHPDPIVETASLASVTPPDITYNHHLQDNLARSELSNAQLETVLYAFQRFGRRLPDGSRAGFFLGDGAGVGKGRQIAAVIKEFWATGGRRVLWVSTSNDLRYDARRDLADLGVAEDHIPVYPPRKDNVPSGSLAAAYPGGGVLFVTYSLLVSKGSYKPPPGARARGGARSGAASGSVGGRGRGRGRRAGGNPDSAAAAAATADEMGQALSALELKRAEVRRLFGAGSRLHQIVGWLGGEGGGGDCLIILDECHKAKNLLDAAGNSSQTGLAVEALQDQLPNARVMYSSATGASEPDNLRYMVRLGAFDYPHISDMINALKRSGLGALEMFCMGLKATGTYVSRTLSYKGAEFITEELEPDPVFRVMYDRSCRLWGLLWNVMRQLPRAAAKNRGGRDSKAALFWSAHQRFYRQMLIASKVKRCAELAADALRRGMCVVVGLQSTGEANLAAAREVLATGLGDGGEGGAGDGEDFVSAPKMIMHNFISQWLFHFTVPVAALMDKRTMQKLQAEIYRVCVEWRQLPSCEEEAMKIVKQEKRLAAMEAARLVREQRAAAAAAAASGSSPAAAAMGADASTAEAATSAYGTARRPGRRPRYDKDEEGEREAETARARMQVQAPDAMDVDNQGDGLAAAARVSSGDVEMADAGANGGIGTAANGFAEDAGAGAAAGGPAGQKPQLAAHESDEDEVVVEGERSLEQVLAERQRLAILAGDLIDLADDTDDEAAAGAGGAGGAAAGAGAYGSTGAAVGAVQGRRAQRDAERRRLLEQADAEEAAAAAAADTRRQEERRAKLQTALARARSLLEDLQEQVKKLEAAEETAAAGASSRGGSPAPAIAVAAGTAAAGRVAAGGARQGKADKDGGSKLDSHGGSTIDGEAQLEDDVSGQGEEARHVQGTSGRGAKTAPAKGRRRGAAVDEDEDEDTKQGAAKVEGNPALESAAAKKLAPKATDVKVASRSKCGNAATTASTDSTVSAEAADQAPAGDEALRPRRAAQMAAAHIDAINRGEPIPPKQPRGPSAPPAKAGAAVKLETGAAKPAAKPAADRAAAGRGPAAEAESDSVIIIDDSSEDEDAGMGAGSGMPPAAAAGLQHEQQPSGQAVAQGAPAAAALAGAGDGAAADAAGDGDHDDDVGSIGEEISNPDESEYQPATELEEDAAQPPPPQAEPGRPGPQWAHEQQPEGGTWAAPDTARQAEPAQAKKAGKARRRDKAEEEAEGEGADEDVGAEASEAGTAAEDGDDCADEDEDEDEGYDDTLCTRCGGGDDPASILLCDTCDAGYHMGCLDPPLEEIPDGDWHCPKCTASNVAEVAAAGAAAAAAPAAAPSTSAGAKRKAGDGEEQAATGLAAAAGTAGPVQQDPLEGADSEDEGGAGVNLARRSKRLKTVLESFAAATGARANGEPSSFDAEAARGGRRRVAAIMSDAEQDRGAKEDEEGLKGSIRSHATAGGEEQEEAGALPTRSKRGGRLTRGAVPAARGRGSGGAGSSAGGGGRCSRDGMAGKGRGHGRGTSAPARRRRAGKPSSDGEEASEAEASPSADEGEDENKGAAAAAKGGAAAGPTANPAVGKIRMQLRVARQRLKDAAARAAAAERDLKHFTRALAAAAAAAANGGHRGRTRSRSITADEEGGSLDEEEERTERGNDKANGRNRTAKRACGGKANAKGRGRGKQQAAADSSSSSSSSGTFNEDDEGSEEEASESELEAASSNSSGSSSSEEEDAVSDEDAAAAEVQRLARQPDPTKYRHAAKAKPLGKLPGSWAAGGGGGGGGDNSGAVAAGGGGSRCKGQDERAAGGKGKGQDKKRAVKGSGRHQKRRAAGAGGSRSPDDDDSDESSSESDSDDNSDDSSVTLVTEEEEGGEGDGGEGDADHSDGGVELIDEEEERMRERRRTRGRGGGGGEAGGQEAGGAALPPELRKCRAMLLRLLDAQELPLNPLDQLLELLGGPEAVAEMTGRKVAQVRDEETGRVVCVQRRDDEAQKMVNMAEKEDFMSGRKLVAVISDAASTGISLQADRRVANQRRRFHITLELPWSADKAIQQFGRSHRSNQASAPEYCLLVTKCGGEYRFAGAVAKRLTSLGALLRGDRRALGASSDLKPYDVDNRYGEAAVQRVLECMASGVHTVAGSKPGELPSELLPPDVAATPPGSVVRQRAFLAHMQRCLRSMGLLAATSLPGGHVAYSVERKDQATGVPKFLNRLLGLPLRDQDLLFGYFLGIMDSLVKQARSAGDYDEAIVNIGHSAVKVVAQHQVHVDTPSGATTHYMELDVDDGLSWPGACAALAAARDDMAAERAPARIVDKVGFYVARRNSNVGGTGHPLVVLATAMRQTVLGSRLAQRFRIQRPNQVKGYMFTLHELEDKYRKVDEQTAELHWAFWYAYLDTGCLHGGECVRRKRDGRCNYGSRFYRLHLVTGAVLPVLRKLFDTVLQGGGGGGPNSKKQAPRVVRATIREEPEEPHAGQQQGAVAAGGQLLLEGPEAAAAVSDKEGKEDGNDEVVEVVARVKREGERARARKGRAPRPAAGSATAAEAAAGSSAGAGPSASRASGTPGRGAGSIRGQAGASAADPGLAGADGGSAVGVAGASGAAAVPGGHAHAGVAGEGNQDSRTRVVVGLSLTERDAEQFLQAVVN